MRTFVDLAVARACLASTVDRWRAEDLLERVGTLEREARRRGESRSADAYAADRRELAARLGRNA